MEIIGGHVPEYHVIVDPLKLQAAHLALQDVRDALTKNNLVAAAGMMARKLSPVSDDGGRARSFAGGHRERGDRRQGRHPVRVKDVARVERGPEPNYTIVTAQGRQAVLFNIESQPDANILQIAATLKEQLKQLHQELPPDMHLAFFYDQSQFVRDSVGSVWDAIVFGLILSVFILYFFLKNWGSVLTAIVAIPITVLITFVAMKVMHMSFNMMTLGGVAAAIGLVIDDAIVVVEAMFAKIAAGRPRLEGIQEAIGEIFRPLVASTLTPVVVFLPLAYLNGMAGVFFRALGLTMVVALLVSLVLAVTLTPSLAGWFIRGREKLEHGHAPSGEEGGFLLRRILRLYESTVRWALRHAWLTLLACALVFVGGVFLYRQLETGFLPGF